MISELNDVGNLGDCYTLGSYCCQSSYDMYGDFGQPSLVASDKRSLWSCMGGHVNIYTLSNQYQRGIYQAFPWEESSNLARSSFRHGLLVNISYSQS